MKRYSVCLPSHVYNQERVTLVGPAMATLARTVHDGNKPMLMIIFKNEGNYNYQMERFSESFDARLVGEPSGVGGTEMTLAWGTQQLFDDGADYVTWMGDDALFHPQWHMKLRKLIEDKSEALGWSVYRSAYEEFHKTELEEHEYVRVSSLCGHGMTFSKEEWKLWEIDWRKGFWASPGADTLDLYHAWVRKGERWTTRVSYIEHTGRRGVHALPHMPEWAVNFQGCN